MAMEPTQKSVSLEYARPGTAGTSFNGTGLLAAIMGAVSLLLTLLAYGRGDYFFLIVAVVTSLVALGVAYRGLLVRRANESLLRKTRGTWLGLVAIILAASSLLLAFLAAPGPSSPRAPAARSKCASNLRQIGQAAYLYANENQGHLPDNFAQMLLTEDLVSAVFVCPHTNDTPATGATTQAAAANIEAGGHCSYVYLGKDWMEDELTVNVVLAYEPLSNHANVGMNVLYGDGHVDFEAAAQANKILAELNSGHNPPRAEKIK